MNVYFDWEGSSIDPTELYMTTDVFSDWMKVMFPVRKYVSRQRFRSMAICDHCLSNCGAYLNGEIDPASGRLDEDKSKSFVLYRNSVYDAFMDFCPDIFIECIKEGRVPEDEKHNVAANRYFDKIVDMVESGLFDYCMSQLCQLRYPDLKYLFV